MENKTEAVYTRLPNCNNPLLSFMSSLLMINIINTCNHLPRYMLLMSQVSASQKRCYSIIPVMIVLIGMLLIYKLTRDIIIQSNI